MNSTNDDFNFEILDLTCCILICSITVLVLFSILIQTELNSYTNLLIFFTILFQLFYGLISLFIACNNFWFKLFNLKKSFDLAQDFIFTFKDIFICLLNYHRFRLIKYPMNENEIISSKIKYFILIFLIFLVFFIINLVNFIWNNILTDILIFLCYIPTILDTPISLKNILMIRLKRKKFKKIGKYSKQKNNLLKKLNNETKAILGMVIISVNSLLLFFYDLIAYIYFILLGEILIEKLLHSLIYVNIVIEIIILMIFNSSIRKNLIKTYLK